MKQKKGKKRYDFSKLIMAGPISLVLLALVALPFLYILAISFFEKGTYGGIRWNVTLNNYAAIFKPLYLKVFVESFGIAAGATVICILIAYPLTYYIAQKSTITKTVLMAMISVPMMVSSLIRLFSWINLLRSNGIINNLLLDLGIIKEPIAMVYNQVGSIIGLVYILLPFMILPLYSSIEKLDQSYLEASSDLGARPSITFVKVTLPLTMPGIFAGSLLVFIPALGLYYVTDLLGGSKTQLVGNIIKNEFITARNWPVGAALSIFLIGITLFLVWGYQKAGGSMDDLGV